MTIKTAKEQIRYSIFTIDEEAEKDIRDTEVDQLGNPIANSALFDLSANQIKFDIEERNDEDDEGLLLVEKENNLNGISKIPEELETD